MATKPTIVLIPGAWHKASRYELLTTLLEKAGYKVVGIDYPSTAPNPTTTDFWPDVAVVQSVLAKLSDQGDEIVLIVHSAAGILGGQAAEGFSKAERSRSGKVGGITRLVYIAAFAAKEGQSLYDAIGGPEPWHHITGEVVRADDPASHFYNSLSTEAAKEQADMTEAMRFSKGFFESRPTYSAWKHIPGTYLICENDQAIPSVAQEAMSSQEGSKFAVVRCKADHSPFLCMPEFTAEVVRKAAGESI